MKKFLIGCAALIGLGSTALAADMPVKAAPMAVEPGYNWSGFYIGAQGGGAWVREIVAFSPPSLTIEKQGGVYGGQLGVLVQLPNRIVAGLEINGLGGTVGSGVLCPNPTFMCNASIKNEFQVVGRVGYAFNNVLPYVKVGFVDVGNHFDNVPPSFAVNSVDTRHGGWVAGGGLDYMILPNIILGIDYSHIEADTRTYNSGNSIFNVGAKEDIVTLRLSYLFTFGIAAPLVANY